MANGMAARAWSRCARCGGQVHRDPDGAFICLWCGEMRYPTAGTAPPGSAEAYGVRLDRSRGARARRARGRAPARGRARE